MSLFKTAFLVLLNGVCASLLFIQMAFLSKKFVQQPVHYSQGLEEGDMQLPSISVCSDVRKKYGSSSYLQTLWNTSSTDTSIQYLWDHNAFDSASNLYNCTMITGNETYGCLPKKGIIHEWKRVLTRYGACDTLMMNKTIRIYSKNEVVFKWNTRPFLVHNTSPCLYFHRLGSFLSKFTSEPLNSIELGYIHMTYFIGMKRRQRVTNGNKRPCEENDRYDQNECFNSCIEKSLSDQERDCAPPWLSSTTLPPCKTFRSLQSTIDKIDKTLQEVCQCPPPCRQEFYPLVKKQQRKLDLVDRNLTIACVFGDEGVKTLEEYWGYPWVKFLSNIGGSTSFIYGLSMLSLPVIIETLLVKGSQRRKLGEKETMRPKEANFLEAFNYFIIFIAYGFFIFQTINLLKEYLKNQKSTTFYLGAPRFPSVSVCSSEVDPSTSAYLREFPWGNNNLPLFWQMLYVRPTNHLLSCSISGVDCINSTGIYHKWNKSWHSRFTCDTFMETDHVGAKSRSLRLVMDPSSVSQIQIYIHPYDWAPVIFSEKFAVKVSFDVGYTHHIIRTIEERSLPPCNHNYFQCYQGCVTRNVDSDPNITCGLAWISSSKCPCDDKGNHSTSYKRYLERVAHLDPFETGCTCSRPCQSIRFEVVKTTKTTNKSAILELSLSDHTSRYVVETWPFSLSDLMMAFGGSAGLFVGVCFLGIITASFGWCNVLLKKSEYSSRCFISATGRFYCIIKITAWIVCLYQIADRCHHYWSSPIETMIITGEEDSGMLSAITVCSKEVIKLLSSPVNASCTNRTSCIEQVVPESWSSVSFPADALRSCSLLGYSCMESEGAHHKWTSTFAVERTCSSLTTVNISSLIQHNNKIYISMSSTEYDVYLHDNSDSFLHYTHLPIDVDLHFPLTLNVDVISISGSKIKRKESCISDETYSWNKCVDKCIQSYVSARINCSVPWMSSKPTKSWCIHWNEIEMAVNITMTLDRTFLNSCDCGRPCVTIYHRVIQTNKYLLPLGEEPVKVIVFEYLSKYNEVVSQHFSYSFSDLIADIGSFLGVIVGFSLYSMCYSGIQKME